jgi:hypothetical protein
MSLVPPDKDLKALVDRLLLEQGRLDPLELLLAAELLAYEDYESWRMGHRADIQGVLGATPEEVVELLERAGAYAAGQGLAATALEHRGWGSLDSPLHVGDQAPLVRACATAFSAPPGRLQMDLFQDSSLLLLEEQIRQALTERRTDQAREQVALLMRQDPRHRHLHGFLRLIQVIDDGDRQSSGECLGELLAVEPMARELLGHRARDFLAPLWATLAESLAGRDFEPAAPQLHASFAWARAGRWEAARRSVEAEVDWRGQAILVLAHAEACWRQRDKGEARRDWMWLCWEHSQEAERTFASSQFPDRRLGDLWNGFGDLDPPLDTEDFPAWLLLEEPVVAACVTPDSIPADGRGAPFRLLQRLVGGDDDIELRRELSEIHPQLLRLLLERQDPLCRRGA